MAIPLCLPNNCRWNSATSEYNKTGEKRSSLYVVDEALQKLRTVKGNPLVYNTCPYRTIKNNKYKNNYHYQKYTLRSHLSGVMIKPTAMLIVDDGEPVHAPPPPPLPQDPPFLFTFALQSMNITTNILIKEGKVSKYLRKTFMLGVVKI